LRFQSNHLTIKDDFLVALAPCVELVELHLCPCILRSEGMRVISGFTKLEICHLAGVWNEAEDDCFAAIAENCVNLKSVSLGKLFSMATDAAFVSIATLPQLEMLDLNLHRLSDQGLKDAIPNLGTKLRALSLRYCKTLSDESVLLLAKYCCCLKTLDLSYTDISAGTVEILCQQLPLLRFLNATGMNIQRIDELRRAYPKVAIN
jgi:hypothetical protein